MIIIATHAVFMNGKDIYGPPHAVSLFLNKQKDAHIFIKHNLYANGPSKVEYYRNGKLEKEDSIKESPIKFPFFLYLYEMYTTLKIVLAEQEKVTLFIGVDPLNALAGEILKNWVKQKKMFTLALILPYRAFQT